MKLYKLQRKIGQGLDQLFASIYKKLFFRGHCQTFDGDSRFALITVNFSTTYYLKLMLLTLSEQYQLNKISRIVITDNDSRDGGPGFLNRLQQEISCIHFTSNHFVRTHARGLRKGIALLNQLEKHLPPDQQSNVLMVCDTDIIFRNPQTLNELSDIFNSGHFHFAGELRYSDNRCPQAQASFLNIRRDIYARQDILPFVHHGSPAYPMQKSLWNAGLKLKDFRSNFGGYILHRGRSGVAAASHYYPASSYSGEDNQKPHYMAVENGEAIWKQAENKYSDLLQAENEDKLILYLKETFKRF